MSRPARGGHGRAVPIDRFPPRSRRASAFAFASDTVAVVEGTRVGSRRWAWILAAAAEGAWSASSLWDGRYTAACPECGEDCTWNAYWVRPLCICFVRRRA